jgi:hypothetical protein
MNVEHVLEPLSPAPGESQAYYIGAEDVKESFRRVLTAADEGDALTLTAAMQYADNAGGGGGGGGLPASTPADDGKVLTVDHAGAAGWADLPPEPVPDATANDSGMYLRVNHKGHLVWAEADPPPVTLFADDLPVTAANTPIPVTHNLGSMDVTIHLVRKTTPGQGAGAGEQVTAATEIVDADTVRVTLTTAVAAHAYRILVRS